MDNQSANNYVYDSVGNLIRDNAFGISDIIWTVYGKPGQVSKSGGNIRFRSDAGGNRIVKETGDNQQYYIRDAQGNILSVYSYDGTNLTWAEQNIYGSSRLGTWSSDATVPVRVMLPQNQADTLSDWYLPLPIGYGYWKNSVISETGTGGVTTV